MTKILMVCLGNICRSPLAHGLLESKLPIDRFYVDSAGTANYHVGDRPDKRSIEIAAKHDLDISTQLGRQFKVNDFDSFDRIYVMDRSNYYNVQSLARNDSDKLKVKMILEEIPDSMIKEVPDPYYGGQDGFKHVYDLLDQATTIIAKDLLEN